ncbi:MAG: FmdB family zinc ribbon protein [Chloroflexota bacterium]
MPTYDYVCSTCGRRFEVIHGVNDAGPERCPNCGATTIRKAFSAPSIHFKGTGWAKKERNSSSARKSSSSSSSSSSSESSESSSDSGKSSDSGGKDGSSGKDGGAAKDGGSSKPAPAGPTAD